MRHCAAACVTVGSRLTAIKIGLARSYACADELLALITRLTQLYSQNYNWTPRITGEEMVSFINICLERAGADSMITPREMLRDYMTVLNILMQNPDVSFSDIVGSAVTLKTVNRDDESNSHKTEERAKYSPEDIDF